MKPVTMRRSDVFFLTALLLYAIVITAFFYGLPSKYVDWFQLGWAVYLAIGAGVKCISNPWQKWFNAYVTFFKPKNLAFPDGTFTSPMYEFSSYRAFPVQGRLGALYRDLESTLIYQWNGKDYVRMYASFE